MTTFRSWLAAWACLGMLVGQPTQIGAADPAPAANGQPPIGSPSVRDPAPRHLDTAFIPATAFFAAVVHPQAVLSSSDAEAIPKEAITLAAQRAVGFDPLKIDEAVFVSALTSEMRQPPLSGFVLRFTEAYSKEHVVSKLRAPKNVDLNGKTVFQPAGRGAMSFYFPDERTIVIAELPMLKQMLAAKDVDSPLINLLKRVDVSAEATALLSMDALRDLWHQALAHAPPIPPRFQPFLKLPDLLTAAMVRIDIGQRFKARLTLRARDDAAGQEIESLVNQGLEMARQAAQAEIAKLPRQSDDPVDEAANRYLARITNKLFGLIKPFRTGQNVSIVVETGGGPATLGILVGMLLPAVQAARAAANRNTNLNKLRQIALAMHNYESGKRRFPARAIFDKNGKPLLSWRVKLLPVLGEANLYNQFHLDEPWDSEHNKALINETSIYAKAGGEDDGKTVFLVPVGKGLGFEGDEGISPGAIADGESRTIMAVEANDDRAVPWTKPDDLEVDLNKPLDGLGDAEPGGLFGVVFFDGHAAFIHKSTDPDIIKALFTRAGGEVVNPP